MSRFPTELRRWRTARRLSQMELATRAGTTQRHVSFVELGRSRPGRNVVMRLAESLDLTLPAQDDVLGFAVPLELSSADGDLRLITTLTSFATATDVTLAELHLEAFLPADDRTGEVLRRRWG